jgi:hypothetical protein
MQRHPLDPVSLVAGLLFAGFGVWLLTGRFTPAGRHLTLVWAFAAVILGLALAWGRRSGDRSVTAEVGPTVLTEPSGPTEPAGGAGNGTTGEIGED